MSLNIIGLGGPNGVGKSTTAALLGSKLGFVSYPLSLPLRRLCAAVYEYGWVFVDEWERCKDIPWSDLGDIWDDARLRFVENRHITPRDTVLHMGANGVVGETLGKLALCTATLCSVTQAHQELMKQRQKAASGPRTPYRACIPDIRYEHELEFWEATRGPEYRSAFGMYWLHREAEAAMPDWMVGRASPVDISCPIQMARFIMHVKGLVA